MRMRFGKPSGRNRRRGFTLLELMIVVVMVAILASLAIARYMNLQDKGQVAAATYDLDLVRKILAYYATDYSTYPAAAASYEDLKSQMVDPEGRPYGWLPLSYTYTWLSYGLDLNGDYSIRIQVSDRQHTVLVATPEGIERQ